MPLGLALKLTRRVLTTSALPLPKLLSAMSEACKTWLKRLLMFFLILKVILSLLLYILYATPQSFWNNKTSSVGSFNNKVVTWRLAFMVDLELVLSCFNWTFMVDVLKKCYMLQSLIIQNDKEPSPSWKRLLPKWGLPELTDVPNCVVPHLTFVHFKGFKGLEDDIAFAKYILQKGLVLKIMIITDNSLDLELKFSILQRLSDVPRASCTCRLLFD